MAGHLAFTTGALLKPTVRILGKVIVYLVRNELKKSVTERMEEILRNDFQRQIQEIDATSMAINWVTASSPLFDPPGYTVAPMWLRDP